MTEQTTLETPLALQDPPHADDVEPNRHCGQCGMALTAGNLFCGHCGHPISPAEQAGSGQPLSTPAGGQHMEIHVPYPEAMERHLRISVGACHLRIRPGDASAWVTGTYDDPTGSLPCRISRDGGVVRISQEPRFISLRSWKHGTPAFDLALGAGQSYALTIETGANESAFDLGGLPLTRLVLKLGAGKNVTRFLEPNPQPMSVLDLDAGAGDMELRGLANANFGAMTLDGGAASFTCDFGGSVQREASVHINTGLAAVTLLVPAVTAARIIVESSLGRLDLGAGFTARDGGLWTAAAVAGGGPLLVIHANVALGSLRLQGT